MSENIGYQEDFIEGFQIDLPVFENSKQEDIASVGDTGEKVFKYIHYSLMMSKLRKFPYFTVTNIDGSLFHQIDREKIFDSGKDEWQKDSRAKDYQWGQKLYDAQKSEFSRGHMTKREDPQWGKTIEDARKAAQSTFFFTNCVPQLEELNGEIWNALETYILSTAKSKNKLKISVFTGPIFSKDDPYFVTKVEGESVQLPTLFWKVVYYKNKKNGLNRVGFMMGQENLLLKKGIVHDNKIKSFDRLEEEKDLFLDFKDAATYQVNLSTIEKLSGLKLHPANEPYKDTRPIELILEEINIKKLIESTRGYIGGQMANTFEIKNIVL